MASSESGSRDRLASRVVLGIVAVIVGWLVFGMVLHALYSLIRMAVMIVLLGVVLWFVFVGPSSLDE